MLYAQEIDRNVYSVIRVFVNNEIFQCKRNCEMVVEGRRTHFLNTVKKWLVKSFDICHG